MRCPAAVTIIDSEDNEFKCSGFYFGTGRITCVHEGAKFVIDPACYCPHDAKRLCSAGGWTEFRVKSVILDSKAIIKTQ